VNESLHQFIAAHQRLFVLTGAGVSTASGIPDYRDERGEWKQRQPMDYREFVGGHAARQRYWSRSYYGWQRISEAQPNAAHHALARLERLGRVRHTVTQNVDGLHRRAGSQALTELHGSLQSVDCLDCGTSLARASMQQALKQLNPQLVPQRASIAPDGDAQLHDIDESTIEVPGCPACGGILKPAVVFFGESVPAERVQHCRDALAESDALLVVGSSLMVYSGFRFVREAARMGIPVAAVNRGRTRADDLLQHKFELDCASALDDALRLLDPRHADSA
jgi:NAD-dependent SIR2 family protein deacetylase